MVRILIIGNAEYIWIKKYVNHILLTEGYNVTVFLNDENSSYYKDYIDSGVKVVKLKHNIPLIGRFPKLQKLFDRALKYVQLMHHYDIIHVHFADIYNLKFMQKLRKRTDHVVLSYWGSDLLRDSKDELLSRTRYLDMVDMFTLNSAAMLEKFNEVYKNRYTGKSQVALFGISVFDELDKLPETGRKNLYKLYFGIDTAKTVIAIGYNKNVQQQHIKVIEALCNVKAEFFENVVLVLPMAYGNGDQSYVDSVRHALNSIGCEYKMLLDFYSDLEIAKLRAMTDVFIHAQTTDAFSGSVQEYLYAGCTVYNPVWINYSEAIREGIQFCEYSDFTELAFMIEHGLKHGFGSFSNKEKLRKITSWDAVKNSWLKVYDKDVCM